MALPLAPLLVGLAGPVARQILLSLGIGIATFAGLDIAVTGLVQASANAANSMSAEVAQIFGLAGGFQAMSIIAGGVTFRMSMIALKRFRLL